MAADPAGDPGEEVAGRAPAETAPAEHSPAETAALPPGALAGCRFGIVVSLRDEPSRRLADGAESFLTEAGAAVSRWPALGAFEVAQFCGWLADSGRVEAIVACANIVRGETAHDRHLGTAVTGALLEIGVRTGVPVGNAVLTVESAEQAAARSGGDRGNRGTEAARAAANLLLAKRRLRAVRGRVPSGGRFVGAATSPGRDLGPPDFPGAS